MILTKDLNLDQLSKIIQIAAIFCGAFFAYVKWFRGRIYQPRLEMTIEGTIKRLAEGSYLHVIVRIKNTGLSRFIIMQRGTGLRVLCSDLTVSSQGTQVVWDHFATYPLYLDHAWLESGELIEDQHVIPMLSKSKSARLEVLIASRKISWNMARIVFNDQN